MFDLVIFYRDPEKSAARVKIRSYETTGGFFNFETEESLLLCVPADLILEVQVRPAGDLQPKIGYREPSTFREDAKSPWFKMQGVTRK